MFDLSNANTLSSTCLTASNLHRGGREIVGKGVAEREGVGKGERGSGRDGVWERGRWEGRERGSGER